MHFVKAEDPQESVSRIIELSQSMGSLVGLKNPIMDIQVLAPMHKGAVGVGALNAALQAALNPRREGVVIGDTRYREGDKVIQTRNNYDKNIFNGDIGFIDTIDASSGVVRVGFDSGLVDLERSDLLNLQLALSLIHI